MDNICLDTKAQYLQSCVASLETATTPFAFSGGVIVPVVICSLICFIFITFKFAWANDRSTTRRFKTKHGRAASYNVVGDDGLELTENMS
jgi:hypothetical protein